MRTIAAATITEPPSLFPLAEAKTHAFIDTRYRESTMHFNWHYHPEVELCWVRRGGGLRYVGQSVEPYQTGDLVLLGGNLPHTWGPAPNRRGETDWTVIQFLPERWGQGFWELPELTRLRKLVRNSAHGLQFVGRGAWHIGELVEKLVTLTPYSFDALAAFMEICRQLLLLPARPLNASAVSARALKIDPRLQQVLARLDARSSESQTQAGVAKEVGMSPAAFCRWFRSQTGRNFQRYLNEVRVARVCAQLAESDASITTVASACGFNNLANFNRRFREVTGLSPREFRAETRQICAQRARKFIVRHGLHGALRVAVMKGHSSPPSV